MRWLIMRSKKIICMLFLASCFSTTLRAQEVESIGEFANNDFTWATGIPTLQFSSSFNCTGTSNCQMNWWWGTIRVANTIVSPYGCNPMQSFAKLDCSISEGVLSSNLTISNQFNSPGMTSLSVVIAGDVSSTSDATVNIQNCNQSSIGIDTGSIPDGAICDYLCNTTVVCANGANSSATCQYDTTWLQNDQCKAGICCACLGGIVIIAISISGSISCIVVIILLGSDFVRGQIVICVVGGCSMILGIVCGAVPLRSCSNYVIWIGGDIASIALGSIGTFVTLIFLGYLIVVRCKPEYSLGKR